MALSLRMDTTIMIAAQQQLHKALTDTTQHEQSTYNYYTAWTKGTYNCEGPGPEGVHSSGPLSVGNCPLCRQHRLHYEGVDDGEEENASIQRSQHVCETCLTGHLVSALSHDRFQWTDECLDAGMN